MRGQIFKADASMAGAAFQLGAFTDSRQQLRDVTAPAGGRFVATWRTSATQTGDPDSAVAAQIFNPDSSVASTEFRVNTTIAGPQRASSITGLTDGGFVVTRRDDAQGIRAQIYAADGPALGGGGNPVSRCRWRAVARYCGAGGWQVCGGLIGSGFRRCRDFCPGFQRRWV